MREKDSKTVVPNSNQKNGSSKDKRRERKPHPEKDHKILSTKGVKCETLGTRPRPDSSTIISDLKAGTDAPEVYESLVIHYMDDRKSEVAITDGKSFEMAVKENGDEREDPSSDQEKEVKQGKEEESDCETIVDSVSSQGDTETNKDDIVEQASRVPKNLPKKQSEALPRAARINGGQKEGNKFQLKTPQSTPKKSLKTNKGMSEAAAKSLDNKSKNMKVPSKPSSESSEGGDEKPIEEVKEMDLSDEAPNGAQSIGTDDETADADETGIDEEKVNADQRIQEMELKIEKLEEELREIAALEISLYSVVPEHGSSAHKVHTPARRLSRLYIHACKHWTQDRRASIARNTVSGLVLIAKSCGSDVQRLTFWWSNTVVLRTIISQAFGNSHHSSMIGRLFESNGGGKRSDLKSPPVKWKGSPGSKQVQKLGFMQLVDDWQEMSTFTAALEKIESWIFSRIIESVWWQTLTPHMQSPVDGLYEVKSFRKLSGPALGDQQQGSFSINLWKSAFLDAFQRLCPVRAGGNECGCLPVLARMVMEQCVARLDVAMFNAILRESDNEIPTDPVSDPIVDSKVLPIPAGDLSFGSGAQLKNSIGNWSRWLVDMFGMDADNFMKEQSSREDDDRRGGDVESKSFPLMNSLSDLLMLPKDMLIDRSIRKEVCPSLGLLLIKRILCNFTPDEFCPDPVPGAVLEALNSESWLERRKSEGDSISSFPCSAAPIVYSPPLLADVAEKVADAGGQAELGRNASLVQRRGYTSDDDLDEVESPLTSIIDKLPPSPPIPNGNGKLKETVRSNGEGVRYQLLREVWSV
ncbi:uncharacterized protein LOC131222488 [Magnolia sinica]|uniref:uncharacterized protein LOC131222488 n=1 Tax=Magnolia sinica TaxID=86752 RepID=UPI002658D17B|nr:uncharacterized protein LOC131222488 [Magnolia sinica]XP_058073551.1 uncharacterized protein LOC131222488 [Magnolia sinica]XP_058073552.1 uncharacterized protein LOC131222488 [Magnolia sinica]